MIITDLLRTSKTVDRSVTGKFIVNTYTIESCNTTVLQAKSFFSFLIRSSISNRFSSTNFCASSFARVFAL